MAINGVIAGGLGTQSSLHLCYITCVTPPVLQHLCHSTCVTPPVSHHLCHTTCVTPPVIHQPAEQPHGDPVTRAQTKLHNLVIGQVGGKPPTQKPPTQTPPNPWCPAYTNQPQLEYIAYKVCVGLRIGIFWELKYWVLTELINYTTPNKCLR